jgi:hypothetical protein
MTYEVGTNQINQNGSTSKSNFEFHSLFIWDEYLAESDLKTVKRVARLLASCCCEVFDSLLRSRQVHFVDSPLDHVNVMSSVLAVQFLGELGEMLYEECVDLVE